MCKQTTCKHASFSSMFMGGALFLGLLAIILAIQTSPQGHQETGNYLPEKNTDSDEDTTIRETVSAYYDRKLKFEPSDTPNAVKIVCDDDQSRILLIVPKELTFRISTDQRAVIFKEAIKRNEQLLILTRDHQGWQLGAVGGKDGDKIYISNGFNLNQEQAQSELIAWATEP